MTLLVIVLFAAVVAGIAHLVRVVIDDGSHGSRHTPPRSHHADPFDPRSRLA